MLEWSSRWVNQILFKFSQCIRPFPIPLTLIGTKLDQIRDLEPELRKNLLKFLRIIGHFNGASVFTVSQNDDGSLSRLKQHLSCQSFNTNPVKAVSVDISKPLVIPSGIKLYSL